MSKYVFKAGNGIVGEMDWKLDIICKAGYLIAFLLLLNLLLLSIILSLVIFGAIS